MDRYHQIVLGFDGSSCAEKAAREAMRIAGWSVAPLWSYRVLGRADIEDLTATTDLDEKTCLCSFVHQDDGVLDTIAKPFIETEWHHRCTVGDPVDSLLEQAEKHQADLMVVGTHGHTHEESGVLGPVAREIVRDAACDVLVVREVIVGSFCNTALILGAGDTEAEAASLRRAAAIAAHGGCTLQVLSCYPTGWQRLLPGRVSQPAAESRTSRGLELRRASIRKLLDSQPVPADTPEPLLHVFAHRSPALGILEELERIQADLVVLPACLTGCVPDVERIVAHTDSSVLLTSHGARENDPNTGESEKP